MSTSSVSKGCFVFKPSNKRKRGYRTEDYFTDGSDDAENGSLRFHLFQSLWSEMSKEIEDVQDHLNKKILDNLLVFIRRSVVSFQSKENDWASRMRASEIPTAALVLGVNVTDHDLTIQGLFDLLQASVTPFVVSVQAKECGALQQLIGKVLQGLMGTSMTLDDDEEEPRQHSSTAPLRRVNCSISTLCTWYHDACKKFSSTSPGKKRSSTFSTFPSNPPVVIIFKDFEAFSPRVLQDFILISSQHIVQLPLVFVFGIATSPSVVQRYLPHSVSSLLCIELFQSLSCTQHLATVIDKLLLTSKFSFKPSSKVLQVLVGIFLYHDFSVCKFIKGLQLAVLEHFHSQPLSVLCSEKQAALRQVHKLGHEHVERVRQLPSFMRYVEQQEPPEQVKLLTSDDHVKEVCQTLLKRLHKYHKNFYPVLRCLHHLTSSLPKCPLGKQIRELLVMCLEKNIWENEDYKNAMQLLRLLAKDELLQSLHTCCEILKPKKSKTIKEAVKQLEELISKFKLLDKALDDTNGEGTEGEKEESASGKSLQKTDLFHLQKTLLEMKDSRRTKKKTPYEALCNQAVEYIDNLVKAHLLPPESQPLYEVCYYSSSGNLRRHLNATPRTSIQTALSQPYCFLQNDALKSEDGTISNVAPDICIAYKLHLECGRLINLYDWLEAYATVVAAAEGNDANVNDEGKVDELKHARFIRAVSELEFLGFVKYTKQKTDHVARLTWGGC